MVASNADEYRTMADQDHAEALDRIDTQLDVLKNALDKISVDCAFG